MGKMNMSKKVLIGLALASLMIGIVLGMVFQQTPIQHNIVVTGIYEFTLYQDEAHTIPLVSVEWGEICHNGEDHYKAIYIVNTGNERCYVSWNSTDIPSGITLTMQWGPDPWAMNQKYGINAGSGYSIQLALAIDPTVPLGDLSFTTTFFGHDA